MAGATARTPELLRVPRVCAGGINYRSENPINHHSYGTIAPITNATTSTINKSLQDGTDHDTSHAPYLIP